MYRDTGITSFFPLRRNKNIYMFVSLFFIFYINHERFFHFLEIKRINIVKYFQIRGNENKYMQIYRDVKKITTVFPAQLE